MRLGSVSVIAAALVMAAGSACSSGSKSGSFPADGGGDAGADAGGGVTADQACSDLATAGCGRLQACAPFALETIYGDATTCAQRAALACTPSLGASGSQITPEQVDSCAQAVTGETCDQAAGNTQPMACDVPGTLASGAACGSDAQCQSGYCKIPLGSICGTCTARASSGGACTADAECAAGLVCNPVSTTAATCVMPASSGQACSATQPCSRTLACIGGTCQTPLAAGATCSATPDCNVAQGLYCDTQTTKKCTQTQTATAGQPCGIINGVAVACTAGAVCANFTGTQGTCHPPAADNGLCGPGVNCLAPAACVNGKCLLPNPSSCH